MRAHQWQWGLRLFSLLVITESAVSTLVCPTSDSNDDILVSSSSGADWIKCIYAGVDSHAECSYFPNGTFSGASLPNPNKRISESMVCPGTLVEATDAPISSLGASSQSSIVPDSSLTSSSDSPATSAGSPTATRPAPPSPSGSSTLAAPSPAAPSSSSSTSRTASSSRSAAAAGSTGSQTSTSSLSSLSDAASPSSTVTTNPELKANRKKPRPAVIAGSVVSGVVFLVGLALILLWMKRCRRNRAPQSHLEPYISEEGQISKDRVARRNVPNKEGILAVAGSISLPDGIRPAIETVDRIPSDTRLEPGTPQNETMTQRMHRVEAQLEALLTTGLHDSAPPSYGG
ncbi:hypothetical protein C8R47DRAFT_1324579 [Mycena vitilis]|nr:hypothetical protein C8R47DRAFT_1324579 [Mycena vitilis]